MRWRKLGFWLLLTIFGILILAASWVWTADLGIFKPRLERWVSEKTGRTFVIGDLSIDIAGRIIVVAENVTFANADGAIPDRMMSIGRAEVEIDLASLFSPPLIIETVEISDADIHLAIPADGPPNWKLDHPDTGPKPAASDAEGLPILLRDARIFKLKLVYESADRPAPLEVGVDSFVQRLRADEFLDLKVRGTLSGRDVSIEGAIGTWQSLLAARDIEYQLTGQFDTLSLAASGHIDDLTRPRHPSFSFEASGPDIDDLTGMLGLGDEGSGDISIEGSLSRDAAAGMRLDLTGNLGEANIAMRASFASLIDLNQIDAELRASGPDLSRLLALAGVHGIHGAPFQLVADLERAGSELQVHNAEMLFGDARFKLTANLPQFPSFDDGNAQLKLEGSDLARFRRLTGLPGAAAGPFELDAGVSVGDDRREFFELELETALGRASASGEVRGGKTFLGTTAEIDFEVFDASATARAWQLDLGPIPAERLAANGSIEYVDDAVRTTRPLTASFGDLSVEAEGSLALEKGAVGSHFLVRASADRLTLVTDPFTRSRFIPADEFTVVSQVLIEPRSLRLDDVTGELGSTSVSGDAVIRFAPRIAGSTIRFSAQGDALEKALAFLPKLKVRPGPFALSGGLRFAADALHIEDVVLDRPMASLAGSFSLGMPVDRNWFRTELSGSSDDGRAFLETIQGFEASEAPLSIEMSAERDGATLRVDRFDVAMGDARINASGTLDFTERLDSTRFRLTANVPSIARLGTVDGRQLQDKSFSFDGTIDGVRGELRVENAKMTIADSDVSGSVTYSIDGRPTLGVDIMSEHLAIHPLFVPVETEAAAAKTERPDGRIIPDIAIPFDALAKLDATLRIRIGELERNEVFLRNVVLDASIRDGALDVRDASFHARSGYVRGNALIEPDGGTGRARLALIADDLAFGVVESNADLRMTGDIRVNVEATGNDLRSLAGNLSGIALLDTTGGEIPNHSMMQFFYGDALNEILAAINPFIKSDPVTSFRCVVVPVEIAAGKLETNPTAYFRTDKLNVTLKPEIDLKTERIDISVRSTPRTVLSISAAELINPYVKVVGTMAEPRLAMDEQGVLISGGAAVATGGLSLLAKAAWDRLSRSTDPCNSARQDASKALSDRYPDIAPLERLPALPATPLPEAN